MSWEGKDSGVTWAQFNSTPGSREVTVTGKNNYKDSFKCTCTVGTDIAKDASVYLYCTYVGFNGNNSTTNLKYEGKKTSEVDALATAAFTTAYLGDDARPLVVLQTKSGDTYTNIWDPTNKAITDTWVTYSGGKDYGSTVTVTVHAPANDAEYFGSFSFTYTVGAFDLRYVVNPQNLFKDITYQSDSSVSSEADKYIFTGNAIDAYKKLAFDTTNYASYLYYETDADKLTPLTKGTHYTIDSTTPTPMTNKGTYNVVLKMSSSNFTGGMERSAEVTAGSVSKITIGTAADNPVNVKASYDGNSYTYQPAPAELEYTGSAVRPFEDGTWNLYFGGKVVNASTYDVTYYTEKDASIPFAPKESSKITATDEPKDAGTYYFKIALKDNFDNGTICGSFVIKRKPVTQNNVEIRIDKDAFIYDQQTHKAGTDFPVAVYYNGSNSAIDSSYYTVSVAPSELGDATCTYPGKYVISVTFTGADNFAQETVTREYKIYGVLAEDSTLIEALDSADPENDNKLVNSTYPITKEQGAFKSSFDASKIFLKYAGVECAYQDGKYFTVTTKNMLTPGVASITVKGNGEYFKGSKTYKVYSKGSLDDLAETDITGWMEQENSAGVKERVYPYTGDVVIPSGLTLYYNGKALQQGTDYSVSVEDTTGNEGAIGPHTVKFTGINSFKGSKSVQFYVRYDLSKATIKLTNTSETYTGAEIKPVPTAVTYTNGGSTVPLDPTTDYDIEYENNTAVGTATIKITPKTGRSYSSKSKNFTITGIDVGGDGVTVAAIDSQTYIGKALTPAVTVTRGGKTLSKDSDYTVKYTNNTNVGIATVTVTGINNYSGTKTTTFEITPRSINDVEVTFASGTTPYEVPYNGGKNVVLTAGTDYTVTDSVGGSSKPLTYGENADYTVTYDAKSAVATSASDYGKFIITGHGNYTGTRTINQAFKVVAANIGEGYVTVEKDSTEYTGQKIKPADYLTLSINGEEIKKDYYTVSIVGQAGDTVKDVGEYTVTITGNEPNYTGEKTTTFKVTKRSLNNSEDHTWDATKYTWTLDKTAWDYNNGNEVKPIITVAEDKDLGLSLANGKFKEGTDYTVSYANNTNSGSATDANGPVVKVTGMGNYTGEIWIHFSIGKDISTAAVTLAANEYTYDGKEHKPKVSSVTLNSATLRATRDYTVSYADDQDKDDLTNAGTKKAIVTGTGAYYGTVTKTYTINKKTGTSANISVVPKDYAYDKTGGYYYIIYPGEAAVGGGLQPDLVVTDTEAKITLEEGVDYELVDVINNTNAGSADNKATITIRLKGNYENDTVYGSFVILPRSLSDQSTLATISLTKESCEWDDGNAIDPGVTVYDDLGNPLEKDKDYTLALSDNVNVGDATVTITGINNYKDSLTKKFVIYGDLDDAEISDIPEMFYTGEKIIPHPTIVCGGKTLVEGTDYTLDSYSDNNFKTSGKLRVTIPDDKKKYYLNGPLDIEFYIGDDTTSLVVTTDKAEYTYTGSAIKPSVKVTDAGGSEVAYDADSITYVSEVDQEKCIAATTPDNKKVNVTVMVTTADGAQVPVTGSYKIAPLSLDDCNIGTITNDTYTGKAITPPVSVVIGDIAMTKDVDFEVVYENNVNPGTAKVTVIGINNCTGSKELNFAIAPAKMQNVEAYGYSDSGILLKWTAQNHVDGYLITYSVNGKEKTATTTNNSITLTGLSSSTAYEVGVCTYVTAGGQKYYGTATKVTGRTYPKTSAFLVTSPAKKQAQVSWSVQSGVGYEIYRSTSPSSGFKCIADVPSTKTSFTDTGVKSGKTYYYYIQAYQVVNGVIYNGQPSDVKAITIK